MDQSTQNGQGLLEGVAFRLSRWFNAISAVLLAIMALPVFVDVIARLTVRSSIPGSIEIEEFLLGIIVFLGVALVAWQDGHIRIDFLVAKLPTKVRESLWVFHDCISFIIFAVMSWQLYEQGVERLLSSEVSLALSIPVHYFRFVSAVGAGLLALVLLCKFLASWRTAAANGGILGASLASLVAILLLGLPVLGYYPEDLSATVAGLSGMGLLFLLLFLGMPIGFGMCITGFLGMIVTYGGAPPALSMMGIASYANASTYTLTVVPLFILMGELAFHSGISQDLFNTASKWLGRLPGGLAISSVAGCAGFAAVCGDSLATAVTMGTVALPGMREHKYKMSLATGSLAAGGTLGILIPPSVGFIFYAIVTEESIGKLFMAGIVPGLLLTLLFIGSIYLTARRRPETAPPGDPATFREKLISLRGVIGMLLLFVLILGGILGGFFSPTEGGAVGVVGAFVYALLRRQLSWHKVKASLQVTLSITCKLMIILIGVGILGYFLAATQLPQALAEFVTSLAVNRYIVLAAVLLFFVLLGCLLNVIPMILLVLPTIFPAVVAMGFDPVWFGVVCVLVMEMGQITPPIGVNVFAIGSVATDVPMLTIFRGILPFFFCMILCVVLLIIFPQIATFLPNLMFD